MSDAARCKDGGILDDDILILNWDEYKKVFNETHPRA